MIEQLAQRPALVCPSSLRPIHRIERLIQEQANRPASIHPRRAVLIERRRIPQQRDEVCDYESETAEGDLYIRPVSTYSITLNLRTIFNSNSKRRRAGRQESRLGDHEKSSQGSAYERISTISISITTPKYNHSRHPQRKTMNNNIGIKRLQHISRDKTMVDARVLVLVELGQLVLANIHHGCFPRSLSTSPPCKKTNLLALRRRRRKRKLCVECGM